MKRYKIEYGFLIDTETNEILGYPYNEYVDADIAQELYDALEESRAVVQGLIYEGYMGYLPLRSKIDIALEKADKE